MARPHDQNNIRNVGEASPVGYGGPEAKAEKGASDDVIIFSQP